MLQKKAQIGCVVPKIQINCQKPQNYFQFLFKEFKEEPLWLEFPILFR